jgi:hypothetical protein
VETKKEIKVDLSKLKIVGTATGFKTEGTKKTK